MRRPRHLRRSRRPAPARPADRALAGSRYPRPGAHHSRCSTRVGNPHLAPAAGAPCRRHQRQGLDLRLSALPRSRRRGMTRTSIQARTSCASTSASALAGEADPGRDARALLEEVLDAGGDIGASFFEVTTAAAFLAFCAHAGGCAASSRSAWAAGSTRPTSSRARRVTGIAQLGIDHQAFLGDTLARSPRRRPGSPSPACPGDDALRPADRRARRASRRRAA